MGSDLLLALALTFSRSVLAATIWSATFESGVRGFPICCMRLREDKARAGTAGHTTPQQGRAGGASVRGSGGQRFLCGFRAIAPSARGIIMHTGTQD